MLKRLTRRVKDNIEEFTVASVDIRDVTRRPEFMCGASLAHHGLLGSVDQIGLYNIDLSPVPAQHLASLVSCVTKELSIMNVTGSDLVSILSSVKSQRLYIFSNLSERYQRYSLGSLGREETRALVQAMESRVESVGLAGEMTLDIKILMEYSGQGEMHAGVVCH